MPFFLVIVIVIVNYPTLVNTSTMLSARLCARSLYLYAKVWRAYTACVTVCRGFTASLQSWSRNYCTHPLLGGGLPQQQTDNEWKHFYAACMIQIVPVTGDCRRIIDRQCRRQTVWPCFTERWPCTSWTVTRNALTFPTICDLVLLTVIPEKWHLAEKNFVT